VLNHLLTQICNFKLSQHKVTAIRKPAVKLTFAMPVQFFMLRNKSVVRPLTYEDSAMLIHVPGIAENTISLVLAGHVRCARLYGINIPIFMHAAHTAPHHTTGKRCLFGSAGSAVRLFYFLNSLTRSERQHKPLPRHSCVTSLVSTTNIHAPYRESLPSSPCRADIDSLIRAFLSKI